jgi:hypothetical protein
MYLEKNSDFNQRWSIDSTESYEERFKKFKTGILNTYQNIDELVPKEIIFKFCNIFGIVFETPPLQNKPKHILTALKTEHREKDFYRVLQNILWLLWENGQFMSKEHMTHRANITTLTIDLIEDSNINLSVTMTSDDILLYPKGEVLLDKVLVDSALSFLDAKSSSKFKEALEEYQAGHHIKSVESIRRCLEEYLRHYFNNSAGLAENIKMLGKKLKNDRLISEVRTVIHMVFDCVDKFFNEHSKHNDGNIKEAENEYIIYQAATLMRYINKAIL